MTDTTPAWEPPFNGSETDHLIGILERQRATFRWKADGLGPDGLRFRIADAFAPQTGPARTSTLTLGALLKHLAVCEDDVFSWRIAGERPTTWCLAPEGTDPASWQFTVGDDETPETVYGYWDDAVRRSREQWARLLADGGLDRPGHLEFGAVRPSIRRHVCDLIEEYGRHVGHADLIREAFDGRVGEDPPGEWVPSAG